MEPTLITKCCELNEHSAYRDYMCWQIHYTHNCHYKMGTMNTHRLYYYKTCSSEWLTAVEGQRSGLNRTAISVMTSSTLTLNKILLWAPDIRKHAGDLYGSSDCLGRFFTPAPPFKKALSRPQLNVKGSLGHKEKSSERRHVPSLQHEANSHL